jgi:hypothetical protein
VAKGVAAFFQVGGRRVSSEELRMGRRLYESWRLGLALDAGPGQRLGRGLGLGCRVSRFLGVAVLRQSASTLAPTPAESRRSAAQARPRGRSAGSFVYRRFVLLGHRCGGDSSTRVRVTTPPRVAFRTSKLHKRLHTHRTCEEEQVVLNEKPPTCGAFAEPSDGLEPSTPSLPWRCSTN